MPGDVPYVAQISKAVTSTTVGVGAVTNGPSAGRRFCLTGLVIGSDAATLGTSNFRWDVRRNTTAVVGSNVTARPLDASVGGAFTTVYSELTANGTLAAGAVMTIAISEQATFHWAANPGSEIVVPGTTDIGLVFMTPVCGNTPSAAAQVFFRE